MTTKKRVYTFYDDESYVKRIEQWTKQGSDDGVTRTPSLFHRQAMREKLERDLAKTKKRS